MASLLPKTALPPRLSSSSRQQQHLPSFGVIRSDPKTVSFKCFGQNPTTRGGSSSSSSAAKQEESKPENALLKLAWYSSELLGVAASLFRPPSRPSDLEDSSSQLPVDSSGAVDRDSVVATIKEDFERSYFVTGNLTLDAYEEQCEFADPAGSFKGLQRFKRNCTNFGLLLDKCNMKLMKWEDLEDKGVGHWRFSCVLSFPWKPILSATGFTEYYFDKESGKVCRHIENWNVPKMILLKQILKPSRRLKR